QRLRELGIRVALGAQPSALLQLLLVHGAKLALVGVAAGATVAFALTGLMRSLLFGVSPRDPVTFAGVAALLLFIALLALYLPARRATRVDPLLVLRHE